MPIKRIAFLVWALLCAATTKGGEVSLISGIYESVGIEHGPNTNLVSFGGRYAQQMSDKMFWYAEGLLSLGTIIVPDTSQESIFNLKAGGGIRYYFDKFGERLSPYAGTGASLGRERYLHIDDLHNDIYEVYDVGLTYKGFVGLRFSLDQKFFLDFETTFFENMLVGNHSVTRFSKDTSGKTTESTTKATKANLFVSSTSPISSAYFSLGMRL